MNISPLPVLLAALGLAAATHAAAQPLDNGYAPPQVGGDVVVIGPSRSGGELRSEPVGFRDLDLSTHAGAYTLLGRIRGAAERVCSPPSTYPGSLKDASDYQRCFRGAVGRAVRDIDAPTLEDVYFDTDPGPAPYG